MAWERGVWCGENIDLILPGLRHFHFKISNLNSKERRKAGKVGATSMPLGTNAVNSRRYQSAGELSTICTETKAESEAEAEGL